MLKYILKRLAQTLLVLLCVSVVAFLLLRLAPGNPALLMVPEGSSEEVIYAMEEQLGLHDPIIVQYFNYLFGVLKGDLGTSTTYKLPVSTVILKRLPQTLQLTVLTVIFGTLLAIPLGITAGANRGKGTDFFVMFLALLGQSTSAVWLAPLLVYIFSVKLNILPSMGTGTPLHYIMPVFTLAYPLAAQIARVARSGMIDTLSEDYITSTYAKGVKRWVVNWKYAFKNALIPVVTLLGMRIAGFLAGTVVVETVFGLPGIGQLMSTAVGARDYELVQSLLLVSASAFAIINLVVDIINTFIDPRMTLQ